MVKVFGKGGAARYSSALKPPCEKMAPCLQLMWLALSRKVVPDARADASEGPSWFEGLLSTGEKQGLDNWSFPPQSPNSPGLRPSQSRVVLYSFANTAMSTWAQRPWWGTGILLVHANCFPNLWVLPSALLNQCQAILHCHLWKAIRFLLVTY